MSINACRVIYLPKVTDQRGNLTFIEGGRHVPFGIKRVFYLYDVPGAVDRGGHALKICHQFLIAVSGSFDVFLDDGTDRRRVHLSRPCCGLCIPPMVWREMGGFSARSVCLVLASEFYSAQDYYRDYAEFLRVIGQQPS